MDCATFKEMVTLFALGSLDSADRDACAQHVSAARHDGCIEALHAAMQQVEALELGTSTAPPAPTVWSAIAQQIAPLQVARRAQRRTVFASAAAFACAAGLLFALWQQGPLRDQLAAAQHKIGATEQALTQTVQSRDACVARANQLEEHERLQKEAVGLLELPGTKLFPLATQKGQKGAANAIMHTGVKRAYVIADGLPVAGDGDYQMWIAKGKRVVPAGLMSVDASGRSVVRIDYAKLLGDVGAPDAVMITREPRGGSVVVRGPTILLGTTHT